MTLRDSKCQGHPHIFDGNILKNVRHSIGQTPCSLNIILLEVKINLRKEKG